MFNSDTGMQERTQVFSCYECGLEKTIIRDFEQRGKGNSAILNILAPRRRCGAKL